MTINIHSQINTTSTGLTVSSGWITVGYEPSGWFSDGGGAIRFALPLDFSASEAIHLATLSIRARAQGPSGSWCITRLAILDAVSQVLPVDYGGIMSRPMRMPGCIVGGNAATGGLDHNLSGAWATVQWDMTAAMEAARLAGHLDGGHVVIMLRPIDNSGGGYHQIEGIGDGSPPTLTIAYTEPDPPLDPEEEPIENAQTRSQGDDLVATYITTATPTGGLTRSAGDPVAATVTLTAATPQPGQTRSAGDNPQAVAGLSAVIADAMTRSAGDAPEATSAGGWVHRPLFPAGLFPQGLFQ